MQPQITHFSNFSGGGYPHTPLRACACGAQHFAAEALIRTPPPPPPAKILATGLLLSTSEEPSKRSSTVLFASCVSCLERILLRDFLVFWSLIFTLLDSLINFLYFCRLPRLFRATVFEISSCVEV